MILICSRAFLTCIPNDRDVMRAASRARALIASFCNRSQTLTLPSAFTPNHAPCAVEHRWADTTPTQPALPPPPPPQAPAPPPPQAPAPPPPKPAQPDLLRAIPNHLLTSRNAVTRRYTARQVMEALINLRAQHPALSSEALAQGVARGFGLPRLDPSSAEFLSQCARWVMQPKVGCTEGGK
jgi:hypothetical protein